MWDPTGVQNLYEVKTGCEHGGARTINYSVILLIPLHNPRYIDETVSLVSYVSTGGIM